MYNYSSDQMEVYRRFKNEKAIKNLDFFQGEPVEIFCVTALEKAWEVDSKIVTWVGKYKDLPEFRPSEFNSLDETYWFKYGPGEFEKDSCRDKNMMEGDSYNCHLAFLNEQDAESYVEEYNKAAPGSRDLDLWDEWGYDDDFYYDYLDEELEDSHFACVQQTR